MADFIWRKRAASLCVLLSGVAVPIGESRAAVTISSKPTQNVSCSSGVCTPTAKKAVLNVNDLTNMLAAGNVQVNTGSGSLAKKVKDIIVSKGFSWASGNSLTLDAWRSVLVNEPIAVNGAGGVALSTDDGGTNGFLLFGSKASLSFPDTSNGLAINGTAFTLENSIASLATAIAANPSGTYALANSYDASQDGTYSSTPIPTTVTGTVEGLGNTISNLSLVPSMKEGLADGLFDTVGTTGKIEGMKLSGLSIRDSRGRHGGGGGLAAYNVGVLSDDHVAGVITAARTLAGGLVGGNGGTIIHSSANVRVKGVTAGGLVAGSGGTGSSISLSHANGDVQGSQEAGGLVGGIDESLVSQSYATGVVTGGDGSYVGGLVGFSQESSDINNSYATGTVTGGANAFVGGLVGEFFNDATSESSYSTGAVTGGAGSLVGGFAGDAGGTFANCYWDTTTSGTDDGVDGTNVEGVTGLTTQQLQSGLPAGFDPTVWAEKSNINGGLPYLINIPPVKK